MSGLGVTGLRARDPAFDGRELTALLVDEVQDYAILMLDVEGHVATWNAGARRFKGYEADEIIGRHFSTFYPPEAIAAGTPKRLLAAALRDGRVEEEGWRVRKDGSRFWASVVITAVRDANGTLRGYGKVTRDLSERHAADEARLKAERQFRAAFMHAPIGIALSDLRDGHAGRFVEANPALSRLLGREADALVGTTVAGCIAEEDHVRAATLFAALVKGRDATSELKLRHRDGREIWALVSCTPLPEPSGHAPRVAICQVLDISERKRFESQLRHLADHDALTGLFNRHRFESELDRIVSEARRYDRRGALLMLDLDGFKDVNDRFGHPVGDELVTRIGALLTAAVRATDVVARLGGDEFAIIQPEASAQDAEGLAQRILEAIRAHGYVSGEQGNAWVTSSIGVATFDSDREVTGSELVVEADIAMYDAKAHGRDRLAAYNHLAGDRKGASERLSWSHRLRAAIEHDHFELHAQPILGICGDGIPQYELLLRLRDDQGRLILPGAFLYNAERFDLMGDIDRWVLGRAVRLLEAHERAGHELSLSVNLSGRTMNDVELPGDLDRLLRAHPITPQRLVIEVTETAAIVNIERARELATELRHLGCRFALDDFGSGFASFYYLKHLDFDYLKIDGEFIRQLSRTHTDQLVVRAVVDIARGLQTQTVAEFVGDEPTLTLLRELGIDYGQGYHLGRPGPLHLVLPELDEMQPDRR